MNAASSPPRWPAGFRSVSGCCGIKAADHADLALIASDRPASAAGVFTTNRVQAAPVTLCRERLNRAAPMRAWVVNSGIANACTGAEGREDAECMAAAAAAAAGCTPEEVFVSSTGSIGPRLPVDKIVPALSTLGEGLREDAVRETAQAIMTTDTRPKYGSCTLAVDGRPVTITAVAKGAGMIEPDMATMLAFFATDAAVEPEALNAALRTAVDQSFNRISVDGDRSTNDTVLLLANGAAGNAPLRETHGDWAAFADRLESLSLEMAKAIVGDGEGLSRTVTVAVTGACSRTDADRAARAVANSPLNKTAWAGGRPNWGRVMDALGYSGAEFDPERVTIDYNGCPAVREGRAALDDPDRLKRAAAAPHLDLSIDLGAGSASAVIYTCDLTAEYVRINL
ncbi:bifunctional glutamate N-acetyltransferase/amino-acid acetyltransferase ArgJ [Kiritimatiella glycovorans]|uniref:Arginine biosynthesis bifunctional protein ArgJ n=1 Tax=Kiritimatiella glycovorans TaxID=1307763 RepID=A0A0G3EE73_9BACT|nr:bifunctional glutamate N-acetyltransferase/amino-acid acetyltransferase ArgJ [Kiritimatiella glycovorans]AKJ63717.1 Arginine biosynthesis bifunctional protein ArgJ [Kiritimatiella glycovorans]